MYFVTEEGITRALRHHRSTLSPADFIDTLSRIDEIFDKKHLEEELTFETLVNFGQVFRFIKRDYIGCRNQFIDWLKKHQECYHADVTTMYNRMMVKLIEFNASLPITCEKCNYVNQIPDRRSKR